MRGSEGGTVEFRPSVRPLPGAIAVWFLWDAMEATAGGAAYCRAPSLSGFLVFMHRRNGARPVAGIPQLVSSSPGSRRLAEQEGKQFYVSKATKKETL